MAVVTTPLLLERPDGPRFALLLQTARGRVTRGFVHAHAFAEEMNKSRRMVAQAARALAAGGSAVLLLDLAGCGDSAGDFEQASWETWIEDLHAARLWLAQRLACDAVNVGLWGLRAGALLAAAATHRGPAPQSLLLWQPVISGQQHLQQFLRMATVAAALAQSDARSHGNTIKQALAAGNTVEIGGYALSAALARGLEAATLQAPPVATSIHWLEVSSDQPPALLPPSQARIHTLVAAGHTVHAEAVPGTPFWNSAEILESPALLSASSAVS